MTTHRNNSAFDAFISYSGSPEMAKLLSSRLSRLGVPPWQFRRWWKLNVFFDKGRIRAGDDLPRTISNAIRNSKYFVLLASKAAAHSKWVSKELEFWLISKPASDILIVVVDGTIEWDQEQNDFNWSVTDCIPAILKGKYTEARWEDLRQISPSPLTKSSKAELRNTVISIASKVSGISRDELDSEDRKQHRRLQWISGSFAAGVLGLTVLALILWSTVLSLGGRVRPLVKRVERIPADEAFLEGKNALENRRNASDVKHAIYWFGIALERDSRHVPALIEKAYAHTVLIGVGGTNDPNYDMEQARDALRRAEEYGATAPTEQYGSDITARYFHIKGRLQLYVEIDVMGARATMERAVEIDPRNINAMYSLASTFTFLGQHKEAIELTKRALQIVIESGGEKGDKEFIHAKGQLVWTYFYAGEYDRAIAECNEILKSDKTNDDANRYLGHINVLKGDYKLAVDKYRKAGGEIIDGDPNLFANYTAALARDGQLDEAQKNLSVLLKGEKYVSSYRFAQCYAVMGETENALKQLKIARDQRDPYLVWSAVDPLLSSLRGHPEFQEHLVSVGLGSGHPINSVTGWRVMTSRGRRWSLNRGSERRYEQKTLRALRQ